MLAEDANADRERLVEYVSARFDAIELAARWLAEREQERAQGMVDKLLRWLAKNPRRLLAIEHEFTVRLDDPARPIQLTGRAGRLEVDEQGRLVLIDTKTGQRTDARTGQKAGPATGPGTRAPTPRTTTRTARRTVRPTRWTSWTTSRWSCRSGGCPGH